MATVAEAKDVPAAWDADEVPRLAWLGITAVAILALALRLDAGLLRDLWEDEVIAASHAEHPLWRLPVAVVRNDVHPFLYFLQLHLWSRLGDGDLWLRLNSVFWNLVAIGSLFLVGRRLHGLHAGLQAAGFFALAAPAVWMAQDLRPYSWMYCLLIWAFYCSERFAGASRGGLGWAAGLLLLCVGIVYTHAIGFFAVFLLGLHALVRLLQEAAPRGRLMVWLAIFAVAAISALPPMVVALSRDANLGTTDSLLTAMVRWVQRLLMPRGNEEAALVLSGLVYAAIALGGLAVRPTRSMAGIFLVLPLALASVLAVGGFVLFKLNVFSTMILPFFCLVAARLLLCVPPRPRWAGAGLLALVLLGFTVLYQRDRIPTTGFRAASAIIAAAARPGDIIYVPQSSIFWGMARYLGTDRRGWQLEVAPVLNERWRRMYDRLGPRFVATFELEPRSQTLQSLAGPTLLIGNESLEEAARAPRVWLVTYARADLPPDFPPPALGALRPGEARPVGELQLRLYAPAP